MDAAAGIDLTGKTAIVTGGNSGIGTETVKALMVAGAKVIMTSRSIAAGEDVAKTLASDGNIKGSVVVKQLDLADLQSVRRLSDELQKEDRIDMLICNAGVMLAPESKTADGFELHWGTNYVGHFALTSALLPKMIAQPTHSRVVILTSLAYEWCKGPIRFDDLNFSERKYTWKEAYGQSKLANLLHVRQLAKELEGTNVAAFAVHPGIVSTSLFRNSGTYAMFINLLGKFRVIDLKTAAQGAATSVYAAVSPELEGQSGVYLTDCAEAKASKQGCDLDQAARLWKVTETLVEEAMSKHSAAQDM